MIRNIRKIVHIILALVIITIGLAGLVLPFLNGTLLLIVGLVILSFESRYVEKKLHHITNKNHTAKTWHIKLEKFLKKFI